MANNDATIIVAKLNDKELQDSINKLVAHVETASQKMANSFDEQVKRMEQSILRLGKNNANTSVITELGTNALKQVQQSAKEVTLTYDQMRSSLEKIIKENTSGMKSIFSEKELRSYIDLLRKLEAEYVKVNTQEGGGIKSDKLKRDIADLERIISGYQQILKNIEYVNSRQGTLDTKKWTQDLGAQDDRYKKLVRWYTVLEREDQRRIAREERDNQKRIAELEKEQRAREKVIESARKAEEKFQNRALQVAFNNIMKLPTGNIDEVRYKLERLQTILANIRELGILSPKDISNAETEAKKLQGTIRTLEMYERERLEAERKFVIEQAKEIEQTQTLAGRVQALARSTREYFAETNDNYRMMSAYGKAFTVYNPLTPIGSKLGQGLTIEQQITNALQQETSAREGATNAAQQQTSAIHNLGTAQKEESANVKRNFRDYESLRQAIAAVLGVKESSINLMGIETSSIDVLSGRLKQLRNAYNKLGTEDRRSKVGQDLIRQLQITERQVDRIRKELARPIDFKSAKGLSERTLDDIAYKMRMLASYRSGLDVEKQRKEIRDVSAEYDRLKKKYDEVMQKNQQMVASNNALGRSWNYMKNRLAFYFTVGASTQFIKNLIEVRSQYEMNERALGILINSAERGTQIFNELSQMALVSPYTLIELSSAAKQLVAYDIAAKDVVDTTRRLADMASAVGVPMERLTYALGQIKAYGYLNSRDARMFANAGIPLVRELSKYYSELEGKVVSVGDVYDRMKKKAIDYNSVMAVVTKMTDEGGKFFDFQAKMAGTLKVQLANLTLAWNNMLNEIGSSQQSVLTGGIAALKNLFLHWSDITDAMNKVIVAFGLWKAAQLTALAFTGKLTSAIALQTIAGEKLATKWTAMAGSVKAASVGISAAGAAFWLILADSIMTYKRNAEEIEALNKKIADGAKESSEELAKFLESSEMASARVAARVNKLPKADAEKTWEALREQIELSAMSAKDIIPQLVEIDDLNVRLTEAFNVADRIQEANNKLSDLYDKLEMSQDTILGGILGEGLIEDIEDYNEHLKYTANSAEYFSKQNKSFWDNAAMGLIGLFNEVKEDMGNSTQEAEEEIRRFSVNAAKTIKDELGEEGLKDNIQINEAITRILTGIEQQFPQIKGKGKALFESIFNDIMANEFNGAVDKQAHYYKIFLDRLKKDHASAFQQVTDDILADTYTWSDGQINAIKKTADKIKEDIPEAYQDSVTQILNDLNSREFKLRIVAEFATTTLDEVGKSFRRRFIQASVDAAEEGVKETQDGFNKIKSLSPWSKEDAEERRKISLQETTNMQKYGVFMQKANESDLDYQDRIRKEKQKQLDIKKTEEDIIARNKNNESEGAQAVTAAAKERLKAADEWLNASKEVEDWGGYDFTTKKENAAANKAQHQAETELQKALKQELSLIEEVRNSYKRLTSAGVGHFEAISISTNGFNETVEKINESLARFGLEKLDLSKFAGITNPQELVNLLQDQLNKLVNSPYVKAAEIKELQVKIQKLGVDVAEFNQKTFVDSLNSELGRLKDEYELAVTLDADPELGGAFADMMGINTETLPRTVEEYANEYTKWLNKYLGENKVGIELPHLNLTNDDLRAMEEMVKAQKLNAQVYENIKKGVEAVRELKKKDTDTTIKEWNKLIEKYGEYEAKVNKLRNDAAKERTTFVNQYGTADQKATAVRLLASIQAEQDPSEKQKLIEQLKSLVDEIAGTDEAKLKIKVAIDNSELQRVAQLDFDKFVKTSDWVVATGELSTLSKAAIGGLIEELERYKKTAKNLTPKQIKQINNALSKLYRENRRNNPFRAISNMLQQAKENAAQYNEEIEKVQKDMEDLGRKSVGGLTDDEQKDLDELIEKWNKLKEKREKAGKVDATEWVQSINETIQAVKAAVGVFDDLAKAIGGVNTSDVDKVFSILEKGGQGAMIGAQVGKGWGALIGGVIGLGSGLISTLADEWSGNAGITRAVKASEVEVRRLETAFIDLEHAMDNAYGTGIVGAKRAAAASKELQLAELQHQLALEKSRDSKNRDDERIAELESQIKSLRYEITDMITEITDDLLGSSVGSFAENLVSQMIQSFKQGEDYMKVFSDKFDEMIDNMIMKSIVSRVVGQYLDSIWETVTAKISNRSQKEADDYAKAQAKLSDIQTMTDEELRKNLAYEKFMQSGENLTHVHEYMRNTSIEEAENYRKAIEAEEKAAKERLDAVTAITDSDIDFVMSELGDVMPELGERIREMLEKYYHFGESTEQKLSALQQGISGITEDTAGALEAYMNGVSQQVYLQSDLLTQIRDAVVGFDIDAQVATMGQILLQLQYSYAVQQAIQARLDGWSNSDDLAVRVKMVE